MIELDDLERRLRSGLPEAPDPPDLVSAAAGAGRLAPDLTRQIGEATATHRGLAAAITFGGHAATGSWGVTGPD